MGAPEAGEGRRAQAARLARDLSSGRLSTIVRGEWASGVSWLLRHAADQLRRRGPVAHVVADRPGVVADLVERAGTDGTSPDGAVWVVDDAHRLADAEAEALRGVVLNDGRALLLGARLGAPLPEPLEWMVGAGVLTVLRPSPVTDDEGDEMVEGLVGARVHAGSCHQLRRLSGARPGFLVDLVLSALESGALEHRNGLWRLTAKVETSRVEERLVFERRRMPAGLGEAHAVLAGAGALPVAGIGGAVTADRVADLERWGYARPSGGWVTIDPPILRWAGPALDGPLAPATAATLAATGGASIPDTVGWRLASGEDPPEDDLVDAAAARWNDGDPHGALELVSDCASVAAVRLRADLLAEVGRRREAVTVLDQLVTTDVDAEDAAASERARITMWMGQRDRAIEISRAVASRPDASPAIRVNHAVLCLEGGDLAAAAAAAADLVEVEDTAGAAASILATVGALRGEGDPPVEAAAAVRSHTSAHGPEPDVGTITLVLALGEAGRLDEAGQVADEGYAAALDRGRLAQAWMALCRLRIALYRGQVGEAEVMAVEAGELFADLDHPTGLRWAWAGRAMAAAATGDRSTAALAGQDLAAVEGASVSFLEPDVCRGRGWAAQCAGEGDEARRWFEEAGRAAAAVGAASLESAALHDMARLGGAAEVVTRADALATTGTSRWFGPRLAYARGVAHDAPGLLLEAADGFRRIGADLYAAEAAVEAAAMAAAVGDRTTEREANRRCHRWPRDSAWVTPPLARSGAGDRYLLTPREREMAGLAAAGASNRDIAASLGVSVRTVENVLHRGYHKLGVSGRSELARALGDGASAV